jgi:CRP-like cAMP-binding protein
MATLLAGLGKTLAALPTLTHRAGETVLSTGSKTGQLLILKRGAVVILKDSVEIARVAEPGAVLGELSTLLEEPHTADVRTVEESEFYIADANLLLKDPTVLLYIATIMAGRLVAADSSLVQAKKQLHAGQTTPSLGEMLNKFEEIFSSTATQPRHLTFFRDRGAR